MEELSGSAVQGAPDQAVKRAAAGPFVHSIDGLVAPTAAFRPATPHRVCGRHRGSADGTTSRWVMEKARRTRAEPPIWTLAAASVVG
jgi:hypothetical protein